MRAFDMQAVLAAHGLARGEHGVWTDEDARLGAVPAEAGLFVGWLDVRWDGPAHPHPWLRDVVHVPAATVANGIDDAFRMHSADVCQGCAEQKLGVVH